MRNNDLDTRLVPHDVVVWEGLLGLLPDDKIAAKEERYRRRKRWTKAVACYEVNEMLARKIWHLVWNYDLEIAVMTYLGDPFADALEERLDREGLPLKQVYSSDPARFARSLAVNLEVRRVYDPSPTNQFTFGAKGRILGPEDYNLLGEN